MTFAHTHAHRSDPATSHEAARAAQPTAERHKAIIINVLWCVDYQNGFTSQEIANYCSLDYLQVARRISDLKRDGKVQDSGQTRRSPGGRRATVWELA